MVHGFDMVYLAWRPSQRSVSQYVQVQMVHCLAAVFAGIDHHAITFVEFVQLGNLAGHPNQVAQQRSVTLVALSDGDNVLAGGNENMHGSLRVNVREGVAEFILEQSLGGNASVNDFAEQAAQRLILRQS